MTSTIKLNSVSEKDKHEYDELSWLLLQTAWEFEIRRLMVSLKSLSQIQVNENNEF
mgnify:CR=1 FL=1|tara:strand:- start:481 stop:648 length:168 start_codon:yes stop_codon:yes gene_type:complete